MPLSDLIVSGASPFVVGNVNRFVHHLNQKRRSFCVVGILNQFVNPPTHMVASRLVCAVCITDDLVLVFPIDLQPSIAKLINGLLKC